MGLFFLDTPKPGVFDITGIATITAGDDVACCFAKMDM
jgi:hypothetical protein